MPDKAWKQWERDVAADLGGTRTGPTGRDDPDVLVPILAPECKYQAVLAYRERDMQQARENASRVGKIPALFLKERGGKRRRVVFDYEDFLQFWALLNDKEAVTLG